MYSSISGEGFTSIFMATEWTDKVEVFHFLVKIANYGDVTAIDSVLVAILLLHN